MKYDEVRNGTLSALVTVVVAASPMAARAAPQVLMPTGQAGTVLIIDSAGDTVVGEIAGVENTHGLAAYRSGSMALAGSLNPIESGSVADKPAGMSDDEHAAHHGASGGGANQILSNAASTGITYQIDTAQRRIVKQITVPGFVHHTVVAPDGRYGISTHPASGVVSVIDMTAGKLIKHIATGPVPNYAVANADGSRIWVSNSGNDTISEIDTQHWIVRRNVMVGGAPEHMVLSPDGASLYVVETADGTVAELDTAGGDLVNRFQVGKDPHGIDLSDDGARLYLSAKGDDALVAIDLASGERHTVTLAPAPYHLTVVDGTGKLYVSSRESPRVWVLDHRNLRVTGEIPIRGVGHQMVVVGQ